MYGEDETLLWYVLQVRPKQEDTVARLLSYKGYDQYVPTYQDTNPSKSKLNLTTRKLFPGYVFCRFSYAATDRISNGTGVVTTPGVIRVLGGAKAIPVPPEEIEAIQFALAARLKLEPWPFQAGQKVKIEAGPLQGVSGVVVRSDGKHRIVLSVDLLQRSVAATVDALSISPLAGVGEALWSARGASCRNAYN